MDNNKQYTPRNINFHFRATEEEAALIRERMAESGITDMGAFARKMMIDGYHVILDLEEIRAMTNALGRVGNNINQIARRVNIGGSIYAEDMQEIKSQLDQTWTAVRDILIQLAQIK